MEEIQKIDKEINKRGKIIAWLFVPILVCWIIGFENHWYFKYIILIPFSWVILAAVYGELLSSKHAPIDGGTTFVIGALCAFMAVNVGGFIFYHSTAYVVSRIIIVTIGCAIVCLGMAGNALEDKKREIGTKEQVKKRTIFELQCDYDLVPKSKAIE